MSKKCDKCIYASINKIKKPKSVDEDLTYSKELDAIDYIVKGLEGLDDDAYRDYQDGDSISVYLYQLDKDNIPRIYKSVKVSKKDDDDDDGFEVKTDDKYDLPDDFIPYGSSDSDDSEDKKDDDSEKSSDEDESKDDEDDNDDGGDDEDGEEEPDEGDEETPKESKDSDEKKKKKTEKGSENEDKDSEDDSEDDVRGVEESSWADTILDRVFDYYESGLISDETAALAEIALETVVGRKSVADAKANMKSAHKDVKKWLHYSHIGRENIPPEDKGKFGSQAAIHKLISSEHMAKNKYDDVSMKYAEQRRAARERLNEAKKIKRDKQIADMKSKATGFADGMRSKVNNAGSATKSNANKPVHEAVDLMYDLRNRGFMILEMAQEVAAALIAADMSIGHGSEVFRESVDIGYERSITNLMESAENWRSTYGDRVVGLAYDIEESCMVEAALKFSSRKNLEDDQFGIPSKRKYPIHDKAHVTAAIQRFNFVNKSDEKELADNIIKALKKFDMLGTVRVNDKNRFKKYLDSAYKSYNESYDLYPVPYAREFNVGSMLPMIGSRSGWGTPLSNADEEDIVNKDNAEFANSAHMYDIDDITTESFLSKQNMIFDSEAKKIFNSIKNYINKPEKLDYDALFKKSINFRKNAYTFKISSKNGSVDDNASKAIVSAIVNAGYSRQKTGGSANTYEKDVRNTIITVLYDSKGGRLKMTYDVHDKLVTKTESAMTEAYMTYVSRPATVNTVATTTTKKAGIPVKKIILTKLMITAIVNFALMNEDVQQFLLGDDYDDFMTVGEVRRALFRKVTDPSNIDKVLQTIQKMRDSGDDEGLFGDTFDSSYRECVLEASKEDIDADIRPIIDKLNRLGYDTKYSCSGHTKTRIKEDGFRNGIYNGSLYSTARIVFAKDYKLNPPKGWKKKQFDGKIGFYTEPKTYQYKDGVPDDAFEKWKEEYMTSLREWVDKLKKRPGPDED